MARIEYAAEVRHDGRLHKFVIPSLQIPICESCGAKVFTEFVDEQVNDALRFHLHLFSPALIRSALDRLRISQKEVAGRLGIAEATLSRWLSGTQIQTRSMDRFLRVFLAFPSVRVALSRESLEPDFGTVDIVAQHAVTVPIASHRQHERYRTQTESQSRHNLSYLRIEACKRTQEIVWRNSTDTRREASRRTEEIVERTSHVANAGAQPNG